MGNHAAAAHVATIARDSRAPPSQTSYVIDREGKVVNAWYGYEQGHPKVREFLEKMGIPEAAPTP